jgi:hypothetical protein
MVESTYTVGTKQAASLTHPAGAVLVGLGCNSLWSTLQVRRSCLLPVS